MPVQTRRQLATDPEMCMSRSTAIQIFVAHGSTQVFSNPIRMDVKMAFLNGPLKEEVYVAAAQRPADLPMPYNTKSTSGGIQFLVIKHCKQDVKETNCTAMSFSRVQVLVVIWQVSAQLLDEDTTSRLWLQLQQKYRCIVLTVSHSNLNATQYNIPDKAHPYTVSFHKGTG
ncbi:hypothetical protein Tco_0054522 [Tanacetum coccineum]